MNDNELDIMKAIRAHYPDATPEQIKAALTPKFLKEAYGKLPHYSGLSSPALHNVKTATVGSFAVCYGYDTSATASREPLVALIHRGDKGYGLLGGHIDLGTETTAGEQPTQGAAREIQEEAVNDEDKPVISPQASRMQLITSGIDYKKPSLPVCYHGHALELDVRELAALKEHARKLRDDAAYRAAVEIQSHGEVEGVSLVPLSEALAIPREKFTHPHEADAIGVLAQHISQKVTTKGK